MHAGRVLVTGAPREIIEDRGAATLEDAFVGHMLEAMPPEASGREATLTPKTTPPATAPASRFSLGRLFAFTTREAMQVRRDPVRLVFSFIGSAVLLLIMSFGISQEVREIPFAVFDQDRSPESRAYLSGFEQSEWFLQRPAIGSAEELQRRTASGELVLAPRSRRILAGPCGAERQPRSPR